MTRCWAIYDVYLGTPVLVERCATKEGAKRVIEQRGSRSCGALYLVEQVLPDVARVLHQDEAKPTESLGLSEGDGFQQ
jgi:hypothetical protein